jgi:peptide/nickel transport system permease protein
MQKKMQKRVKPKSQFRTLIGLTFKQGYARLGGVIVLGILFIAVFGPLFAPYTFDEFVDVPNAPRSDTLMLGADYFGRDVYSRFLSGGRSIIGLSFISTVLGVGLGLLIGLFAASAKKRTDGLIMRVNDILLAFPQIVFVLLVVSGFGTSVFLIAVTVGFTHAPRTARIIRAAAAEVMERDFIKAAIAVGEKRQRIIISELLPNVTSPLLVEFGLRMTYSIGLVAAVSFLGLGLQPPAADWGLMINENRGSLTVQPWGVLAPIAAIALFTIGVNFITDSFAKVAIGIDRKGKE